ncbi:MAG TPA: sugar ABC transporter ATP-binding protein [Gemmatimonadaceae bacterium]|nr:sugar ABC transporter ATP-binding protein [Gemmatimonadaceae bacterium]
MTLSPAIDARTPGAPGAALPLVVAANVEKRFGGVRALRGASLEVRPGEVHALVGENGAGKSTLINILGGAIRRDTGTLTFAGHDVAFRSPAESQRQGIAVIHQELAMLPSLSVAENLFMGRMPSRLGWVDRGSMRVRARELLAEVGLDADPATPVSELGTSHQQLVEIAKALSMGARLLVMDEPTASLTEHETQRLLALVRRLRDGGVAIVYVSHRFAEVFAISDRITVMRDGATVRTLETPRTTPSEVVALMVGRELARASPPASPALGPVALELRGVSRAGAISDVSFTVRQGEIVGMAGLVGAGRSETARAVFGAEPHDAGEILLGGRPVRFRSPGAALDAGVAMCAEDRKRLGLFMDNSVRWNISIARLAAISAFGFVRRGRETSLARGFVDRLRVRAPDLATPVRQLSGGNQQKTVLARWLATEPTVLILDEPTHGVDVGAKAEIYALIRELAAKGIAILLVSSELPEILDLSDRIVVMREGRVAGIVARPDASEQAIMMLATGNAPDA